MNKAIAKELLNEYIKELRGKSYSELIKYQGKENIKSFKRVGTDGKEYQFEMYSYIDDKEINSLRVAVSVFRNPVAFFFNSSVSDDFIIDTNNNFIDE